MIELSEYAGLQEIHSRTVTFLDEFSQVYGGTNAMKSSQVYNEFNEWGRMYLCLPFTTKDLINIGSKN